MKSTLLFVLLTIATSYSASAQYWEGEAYWLYQQIIFSDIQNQYIVHEKVKDTVIHDLTCQIIKSQEYSTSNGTINQSQYTSYNIFHSESKVVKLYEQSTDSFYLFHNFNLGVGDTFITHSTDTPNGPISNEIYGVIDSVTFVEIGNKTRQVRYLTQLNVNGNSEHELSDQAIEGIGFIDYFFPQESIADPQTGGPLICFKTESEIYPTMDNCEITVDLQESRVAPIELSQNPFCNRLRILGDTPDEVAVFDLTGKRIKTYTNTSRVDLDEVTQRHYILQIRVGQEVYSKKVLKS